MTEYVPNKLSVLILDHCREKELAQLLDSLDKYLHVTADVVYCHDGSLPDYALEHYRGGRIHTLVSTHKPRGCGIQTRQLFQAAMTEYVLYVQVDQYLIRPFTQEVADACVRLLNDPTTFYVDLAGNQGHGRPSERALFMRRKDYLNIPGIDDVVGGPGVWSHLRWTEKHLQDHMTSNGLRFATANPLFFADAGVWSIRAMPCGGEVKMRTDTKAVWWTKRPKARHDFPQMTDEEWAASLAGEWVDGTVPQAYLPHSFNCWGDIKA